MEKADWRLQQLYCGSAGVCQSLCAGNRCAHFLLLLSFSDIFREFNAKIEGYSTGTGSENDPNAFLNQAVPGAQAEYAAFCFTFVGDGCFV